MPEVLSVWVKAKKLRNAKWIICSKCLRYVNPKIYQDLEKEGIILEFCPEENGQLVYGKIASMIKSSRPRMIKIVTIEGSPHCFTLHAAVNEAVYILGERVDKEHYVVVDGEKIVRISPESIRVARYLSLVDKLIQQNKWILDELKKHSLEYLEAIKTKTAELE